MKISKEFRWEMGHRIPEHEGLCKNVHGHSYKMIVEVSGEIAENGMIIDFYDFGQIINPIIENLDHAFLCQKGDELLIDFLKNNNMKYVVTDFQSTVENICIYLANLTAGKIDRSKYSNINGISVKIFETPNSYAEYSTEL
ncbi:MAG: 6-carboxytetrahydropterin synthase [Ignavibacteria bacterium]|nr:6-carboxytetrahydropterin synthase [Ignavibacteria bacterium]